MLPPWCNYGRSQALSSWEGKPLVRAGHAHEPLDSGKKIKIVLREGWQRSANVVLGKLKLVCYSFQWTSRFGKESMLCPKNLLNRPIDRANNMVVTGVYPVRYVNPTDLPYVEMWNCYKITRSCDPANCV
jgi:hypothetical protein